MIGTSFPEHFESFVKQLDQQKAGLSDIRYPLLTHHLDDYCGFAVELKEKSGCKIIAHKKRSLLCRRGP